MSDTYFSMLNKSDRQLDLSGLQCPMPLLKTKQCLNQMSAGSLLFVKTTDQGSVRDFNSYLGVSKHSLVAQQESAEMGLYWFLIQCG